MNRFNAGLVAGALLMAHAALAQTPPFTISSQQYQPLVGATDVNFGTSTWAYDDGYAVIPLKFAFPWFGATYNSVWVHIDGAIALQNPTITNPSITTCTATKQFGECPLGSTYRNEFPSTKQPNPWIAPFFAELQIEPGSNGKVRYISTNDSLTIEWFNLAAYDFFAVNSPTVQMQLKLTSSGVVTFHYGQLANPPSDPLDSFFAAAGYEDATGRNGAAVLGTGCSFLDQSKCCGSSDFDCTANDWVANSIVMIGEPNDPDLIVESVEYDNLVRDADGGVSFNVTGKIRNFGKQEPTSSFKWKAYLSLDTQKDQNDLQVFESDFVSIGGKDGGQFLLADGGPSLPPVLAISGAASAGGLPIGDYFVLVETDSTGTIPEATESNNVSPSSSMVSVPVDLFASSVTAPAASHAGMTNDYDIVYSNRGPDDAGVVEYTLYLSADELLDSTDFPAFNGSHHVSAGERVSERLTLVLPDAAPPGDFHVLLKLDPANKITETNESNNVVASASVVSITRPDIVADQITFIDPVTQVSTEVGRLGEAARVVGVVSNRGLADSASFKVGVVLSADSNLSLLSDQLVSEQTLTGIATGAAPVTVSFNFTLPTKDKLNQALKTGTYYLFFVTDRAGSIYESSEANNNIAIGPIRLFSPGPDLVVSAVTSPAFAGVGETVPVSRTMRNIGNLDATEARYRYFASANTIVTSSDVPLEIVQPNGTTLVSSTVTLLQGQSDSETELVRLPGGMTPGTYYIGCLVDVDGQVAELDELNNSLASAPVQVVPSSLKIMAGALPDAMVGRPYSFRFSYGGAQGAVTWSSDTTQGALPPGLTLSADGLLSGTPTGADNVSVTAFTIVLTNGSRSVAARVALRVLPTSSELFITSSQIPSIINSPNSQFQYSLGAAGGVQPYTWRVSSGALPAGITLAADGLLTGSPRSGTANGSTLTTFEVRDSLGNLARKQLTFRLISAGSIVIRTVTLPDGTLNTEYAEDIAVENADGSQLAGPITWAQTGTLPDGLKMTTAGELASISGRPARPGTFEFQLTVTDGLGRSDVLNYTIIIHAPSYRVTGDIPEVVVPGAEVSGSLAVSPAGNVKFRVVAGSLPPGVTLSEDGVLSGTIPAESPNGAWTFVAQATDAVGMSGLGAFSIRVERKVNQPGCSAFGGGVPGLIALVALAALRRRRSSGRSSASKRLMPLAIATLLAVPSLSLAQTYVLDGPNAGAFTLLSSRTTVSSGTSVSLPFAFPFYGQSLSSVAFSRYGYLTVSTFDASEWTNIAIPHNDSFYPATVIAPWWEDTSGGTFGWAVQGTAPTRVAIFEWKDVRVGSSGNFSYQARLYETTGQIRFSYSPGAPASGSASVGIMRQLNEGISGLTCTPNCSTSDWPGNKNIDFFTPAELRLLQVAVDQTGYAGVPLRASIQVSNVGGRTAEQVVVRFSLSTDATLDTSDTAIGEIVVPSVAALTEESVSATSITIPSTMSPGAYFVIASVDPDNVIAEQNDNNNLGAPVGITIGQPKPDLAVSSVVTPASASPGSMIDVTRGVINSGNAAAANISYTFFVSDNSVVTISDRALSPVGTIATLAAGQTDTLQEQVTLPSDLPAGKYWVGVCANYSGTTGAFGIDEISIANDCAGSLQPLIVSTGDVTVLTTTLPAAVQYAPYGVRLQAAGGDGTYQWSLPSGTLPPGMSFTSEGDITGSPATTGTFSFEVKVTSGTLNKTQMLSIAVTAGNISLVVVDQQLPAAEFGRPFSAPLIAVGGKPPYRWTLKADSAPPKGIVLSPEGLLEGRAAESGDTKFTVIATDSTNATSQKELTLRVVNPTALAIASTALPTATLKRDYVERLVAVGGRAPYTWAVVRFQKLAEYPTEAPGEVLTAFPDNFGLTIDDAVKDDFLRGVPTLAGRFAVTLQVTDQGGTVDTATVVLHVNYVDGLAITTTILPDAFINQTYAVTLSHNGGRDAQGITFAPTCVQQPVRPGEFQCLANDTNQQLPQGIMLSGDGRLTGVPVGAEGVYTFMIRLSDASGRQDVRGLSLRVRPDFASSAQRSCSQTGSAPGAAAIVIAAMLATMRRRRSAW